MDNYDNILNNIIKNEGTTFTNNPLDKGGPTHFGITQATLSAWIGRPATVSDVQALTLETAKQIYLQEYILTPHFDQISDDNVLRQIVDVGVNFGTGRAVMMLQTVINDAGFGPVTVDGGLGPMTLAALNNAIAAMGNYFNNALVDERIAFYNQIIANDPTQAVFHDGWINRAESFRLPV